MRLPVHLPLQNSATSAIQKAVAERLESECTHQCPRARAQSPDQASSVSSGQPASRIPSQRKRPPGAYPELSRSSSTNGLLQTINTAPICLSCPLETEVFLFHDATRARTEYPVSCRRCRLPALYARCQWLLVP